MAKTKAGFGKKLGAVLLSFGTAVFVGCAETRSSGPSPESTSDAPSDSDLTASVPSYRDVATQVFEPRCVRCHGVGASIDLSSYVGVAVNLKRIEQAVSSGRMPPGAPLAASQSTVLFDWIKAGGPEHGSP